MATVFVTTDVPTPAATVWGQIGAFGSIAEWHPGIEVCKSDGEEPGTTRTLTLTEGRGAIRERLESMEPDRHRYTWRILESPLPINSYVGRLSVEPSGEGRCTIEWLAEFEPMGVPEGEAREVVRSAIEVGLQALEARFEKG
ncbi:MAG: SRPBCC family protein [Myxococcota bacterium]